MIPPCRLAPTRAPKVYSGLSRWAIGREKGGALGDVSQPRYAVVSGDVVGSTQLDDQSRQSLYDVMKRGSEELRAHFGSAVPLDVDIYAGDSWQFLVSEPQKALRSALFYRAYLMAHAEAVDTRLAIAIGTILFVPGNRVSEGDGEAFRLSGRLLQQPRDKQWMRFACGDEELGGLWDDILGVLDALIRRNWPRKRALAITGAIRDWSRSEIAALWQPPVTEGNVTHRLEEAAWPAIRRIIERFESALYCWGVT